MRILILTATVTAFCTGALAQAPPVKMGLWEKNLTIDNGDGRPTNMKARSCITPANWQEMVENANKQHEGCSTQLTKNAKGYTFTGTCNIRGTTLEMNGSTTIQDAEHIVSETHSTSTRNAQKHQTTIRSTSHWVSADCGKVKPGEPEVED